MKPHGGTHLGGTEQTKALELCSNSQQRTIRLFQMTGYGEPVIAISFMLDGRRTYSTALEWEQVRAVARWLDARIDGQWRSSGRGGGSSSPVEDPDRMVISMQTGWIGLCIDHPLIGMGEVRIFCDGIDDYNEDPFITTLTRFESKATCNWLSARIAERDMLDIPQPVSREGWMKHLMRWIRGPRSSRKAPDD